MSDYGYLFDFQGELTTMLDQFDKIKHQIMECGKGCFFATIDFPCKAICDSACWIDDAFRHMIETGNYLCAGALI